MCEPSTVEARRQLHEDLDHLVQLGLIAPITRDHEIAFKPTPDGLAYYAERYHAEDEQLRQFGL